MLYTFIFTFLQDKWRSSGLKGNSQFPNLFRS